MSHSPYDVFEKFMSRNDSRLIGRWGEEQAARWMRSKGFRILAAGYHCRFGEVDLIASNENFICFVEVKTRSSDRFAQAREFVDVRKQKRIRITAEFYLAEHQTNLQPRFDIAEVYAPEGISTKKPSIIYVENAF